MLFRKQKRHGPAAQGAGESAGPRPVPESYYIGPDDLVKGNFVPRGRKKVRQFAVLVDTRVRVVTTGETVDRAVYEALLAANALAAPPAPPADNPTTWGDGGA